MRDGARVRFDDQAPGYEERAGLPEAICREVAALILDGVPLPCTLVDVGAGTGSIGRHLPRPGVRYVGLDLSRPMLNELRHALGGAATARERALLMQADGDAAWPVAGGAADVILFSRSAHLLDGAHALAEVLRVAAPACTVWIGRLRRARDSVAEQLKREMLERLRAHGIAGRNGQRSKRDFLEALVARGGRLLPLRASSELVDEEAPLDSLRSWRDKEGLAGRAVPDEIKRDVLADVEGWAQATFGDLTARRAVRQRYELEGVQLGG